MSKRKSPQQDSPSGPMVIKLNLSKPPPNFTKKAKSVAPPPDFSKSASPVSENPHPQSGGERNKNCPVRQEAPEDIPNDEEDKIPVVKPQLSQSQALQLLKQTLGQQVFNGFAKFQQKLIEMDEKYQKEFTFLRNELAVAKKKTQELETEMQKVRENSRPAPSDPKMVSETLNSPTYFGNDAANMFNFDEFGLDNSE